MELVASLKHPIDEEQGSQGKPASGLALSLSLSYIEIFQAEVYSAGSEVGSSGADSKSPDQDLVPTNKLSPLCPLEVSSCNTSARRLQGPHDSEMLLFKPIKQ